MIFCVYNIFWIIFFGYIAIKCNPSCDFSSGNIDTINLNIIDFLQGEELRRNIEV